MRTIARFVTRPNPEHPSGWDIGIVKPFISAGPIQQLKPNKIYEIMDIMDQMIIKEVGDCCMDHPEIRETWMPALTWGSAIDHIICCIGELYMLTTAELIDYKSKRNKHFNNI